MASSSSSKDKHNFQCFTEANLELTKLPLVDIFNSQIKPVDLFQKIRSLLLSGRNTLHPDQLKLCYLPPPNLPDYKTFDVTLLYTLIRNLCSGLEPTRGWGKEPGPNDTQIGDDIERLRLFRNKHFAHLSSAAIPDDTFKDLYNTLKSVFNRLKLHPGCSVDYEQELIEIKCSKFTYEKLEILKTYLERDKRACLPEEPDISISGKDEVICGNSVEFKANIDHSEFLFLSITWQKRRGENIRCIDISEEKYSGSTNSKLLIRSACKGDEGEYSAFLSVESNGKKYKLESNTISLLVIGERPFLNDLEVSTEEEKIIIHYNYGVLEQSPKVQHIEWRKNDKLLNLEDEKYIGGNLEAKTFTIFSPSNDDRCKYSCTVTNAVGPVTKHVDLDVPRVELSVESTGFFGSKATIRSNVFSCPLPERVQWQKSNNKRIFLPVDITAPAYSGSTDVPRSAILVIPKLSFDEKLFYRLLVWNKIGQNYSNPIYLNVTGSPPNITVSQESNIKNRSVKLCGNVFVYENSPGILSVYWAKDGKKIDITENGGKFSQVTIDEPSLNIKDVNLDDIGDYQLTATNAVGSTKSDVIKLGPPSLLLEKQEDKNTGRQQFTLTIKSFPAPCDIRWSAKVNDDDIFTPIDMNAEEFKGTTVYLPHPVLVVNQGNQLENYTFKIEVNSFVGSTIEVFSGQKYPSIAKKEDSMENTLYEDKGAGLKFALLNNDLANQFPVEKVKLLKFIIQSSGKVADVTSLKSADSAMECFTILQDENIFSKRDVIFVQFLCKVTGCKELYDKCKDYALSQKALCCFERQVENGYTKVQFHVQGDLNNYTRENIINIVETVAGILNCRTDEILVNGVYHSRSFMLVLSMKDIYIKKWMNLSERDCHHLTSLHIDYFILNQKIFQLESSKDLVESKIAVLDKELQFAELCGDLAKDFPRQKFQQLRSILSDSTRKMESLMPANSVLECFAYLLEKNLFSKADVSFIQFLCKETNCEELHNKCVEYARGQEIHFFEEVCERSIEDDLISTMEGNRGFRGRGGRGGRRPWRGRPKSQNRSTDNMAASGTSQEQTEDEGNQGRHSIPIYDSSEFEDNSGSRGRGNRRPNYRGRGSGERGHPSQRRPRSASIQDRGDRQGNGRGNYRGQRSSSSCRNEGQVRFMGYRRLEELYKEDDPDAVLLQLVTGRNGFEKLLDTQLQGEWMFFLIPILAKAYKSTKDQNCHELTKILSTKQLILIHLIPFLDKLEFDIISFTDDQKTGDLLWNLCQLTLCLFQNMQSSIPFLAPFLDKLEKLANDKYNSICISYCPKIYTELKDLQEAKTEIHKNYIKSLHKEERPKRRPEPENKEPPDDFHDLSVLPTLQDLQFNQKPFLRVNRTKGGYNDLQQYLDIQFRLLREDYLHPLREGILDYRRELEEARRVGRKRQTDIRMYENVEILRPLCSKHGVRHVIRFDNTKFATMRWESSRRLLYGSLLCLSSDGFQTMLFATVTERKVADLQNGIVEVQFTEDAHSFNLSANQLYVMAETTAYFEAYRYILQGLQEVGNDMPLQSSIVHCKNNEKPPRYLIQAGSVMPYDFCPLLQMDKKPREFKCPVLNTRKWPSAKQLGMDDSQHKALQMAITKEIAMIQGPPGTGKTYVGLKIVQLLLHNKEMWTENRKMDPILVVCYTNHALDQFLVGISEYSEKLVRIGGRCKTEELEEYSLQNYRIKAREDKSISRTIHEKKSECRMNMASCSDKIERVSEKLKCAKQGILRLNELSQFMDDVHVNSFKLDSESESQRASIDEWLGFDVNMMENAHESDEDKHKNMLMIEWENELSNGSKVERMKKDEAYLVKHPWQLKLHERGALYKCLLKEFQDFLGNQITLLKNDAIRTRKAKSSKSPKPQEEINSYLNWLTNSEKYIVEVKYLIDFMPKYFKRIPKMIQEEGSIIDWLCLDGSPEHCKRIAEVLLEEYLDAKEEAEYENEERRLEEEDIEDDDELKFFSGYSQNNEKDETSSKNLSDASFAILYSKVDRSQDTNGWAVQISRSKLRKNLKKIIDSNDIMSTSEVANVNDVWKLKPFARQRLYRYWLSCYITYMKGSIQEAEKQYDDLCKGYREVLDAEDVEIMRGADVIGMTTTGAAKYRNILQSIRPKIIIVEEAAEVLESHIVTTINSNCQHLILIGDHKQLRPTPTVYFLAKKYNLDLSLFERMVNNDLNYVTLGIQHRMRPEISILMRYENLYPDLNDHEDVKVYEHVKGVTSDVYFLNHSEPETDNRETKSKSNIHEAKFVKRLCRYFLQQDYERGQITILTAYTGQILALKKEMPKNEFEGVRITSIDNFQGEENDIIILSLVRSNSMGITGFLKIDNRICVALSRARKGLFVIGNFELLCSESELWRYVVNLMKDRNSFGKSLILQCGNHPGNSAEVSRDSDFDQVSNGGCYLPCNFILNCSHKCGQICHVSDPKHELYKCLQPCLKKCDNGHFCQRKCFQDCEACKVKVIKTIPSCGHVENVPCSVNEDQWSCKAPCNTILPCIHICKGTCGKCRTQNTHAQCLEPCKKRLSCGHIIDAKCSDDEKSLICKSPCNSKLECGHLCTGTCNACQQGRLHIPCQSKSDGKRLSCGHIIDAICSADEENLVCMKPCGGKLECGHVCSGSCNDCQQGRLHIPCQSKCNRKLICGHRCLALCVKGCPPCDQNCQTACEHTKCMSKCSDPCEDCRNPCSRRCIHQACEKFCSEKCIKLPCSRNCNKTLSCGHACLGICGESCPQMCTDCHLLTFQDSSCEIDKGVRLVTLNDCNHTFCVDSLDRYMFNRSSSVALTLPQCPICFAHIKKSVRYKHVVEELRNDMKTIKRRIHEEKTSSWKIKLKYVKEKVTMLKAKDSEAVGFIVKQLNEGKTELFERVEFAHAQVIILEIIYSIYRSILESVIENTKEEKLIGLQLKRIRQWLFESRRTITKKKTKTVQLQTRYCFSRQELSEVRLELLRLAYLVQFLKFTESGGLKCTTELQELFKKSPFSETKCTRIRLSARVYGIGFDEGLFNDLVSPDVLQHYRIWQYGNWFKCRSGHISNTDQDQTKCPSCEIVIGMKVCHEVIPPKLIVSVPKPDDRKKKAVSSLDDIIQKQMEMMESPQTVGKEIDKSNSLASSQPDSTFKSLYERNISKKVTESSHEENTDVSLLPKNVENKASAILSWQKVSQNQECRKPDTDYSMVSNDSEYPTEVKKWAVHSNRISTDGNIPMENKQTSLKSFQLASLAEALSRPEMKYVQQKTDSTTRKIQNEIPNPTNVSGYKSASSGGDQELTKKVYGTKELLRFKENQGAGFVERNLRERQEEDMDVDYADVSVRQALGGARTYTKSSKCVRSPIDLDIQYDDLAKERGAQVAVIKSEGKEIQRKEPEIEKPSKPDVYQPDVYQPRGLRRRECPKGHMLFRDDEKCRWCDPFRDSPV